MCKIDEILSKQRTEDFKEAISHLSDEGLKELFGKLGDGARDADFSKISMIANELYQRNQQRVQHGTMLKDIIFLEGFIEKRTKHYTDFLERMIKLQVAGLAAYLLTGQDYHLSDGLERAEKEWLNNDTTYSWKEKALLASYSVCMNGKFRD